METYLVDEDDIKVDLNDFFQHEMDVGDAYSGEPGVRSGTHRFMRPRRLVTPDGGDVMVRAVTWRGTLVTRGAQLHGRSGNGRPHS